MTVTKESFVDLQEKYEKVLKLLENSKTDPVDEPYASKYSANQILIGMKSIAENLLSQQEEAGSTEHLRMVAILGGVHVHLGIIGVDTDETSTGLAHLIKCKEMINDYENSPEIVMIAINMYNQFGLVKASSEPEVAKTYLQKAEELYRSFKKSGKTPIEFSDLLDPSIEHRNEDDALKNFERFHTLTLYYLAQIYGGLKEDFKSSIYCHITLQRQLEAQEYDPIDWALNAATLSQFFMEKCGFRQARHHLAAATYIMEKYKSELDSGPWGEDARRLVSDISEKLKNSCNKSLTRSFITQLISLAIQRGNTASILGTLPEQRVNEHDDAYLAKLETFKHRNADVARCWTKYGIFLLSKSKDRLMSHTENIDEKSSLISDLAKMKLSENVNVTLEEIENLEFKGIDVSKYEEEITDRFVLTIEDAKIVFLKTQEWMKSSQEYYSLESLASDYTEIVCDQSQLYNNLLFFEEDPNIRAKLHKRRIDLLENLVNKLNSQYYMQYCRQIWFELGQTYSEILDIKAEKLKEIQGRPKPQQLSKINNLVEKSLLYYRQFIESFKVNVTEREKVIDTAEKPFLQTYFHIAALYGRYITFDREVQLENVTQQYNHYKFIVDYCKKHAKAKELIPLELDICKEMASLLPMKIARLHAGSVE